MAAPAESSRPPPLWQPRIDRAVSEGFERLDLDGCELGVEGAKYLSESVLKDSEMRVNWLSAARNSLGDAGVRHLSEGLKANKTVKVLFLDGNNIGDLGMEFLTGALKGNEAIESLQLANNNFGDEGARHLADALEENQTLETLDISYNNIGDTGTEYLSASLKANETLQWLCLDNNSVGKAGVACLIAAVRVNTSLSRVDLWNGNPDASVEIKRALGDAFDDMPERRAARDEYLSRQALQGVKSAAKR